MSLLHLTVPPRLARRTGALAVAAALLGLAALDACGGGGGGGGGSPTDPSQEEDLPPVVIPDLPPGAASERFLVFGDPGTGKAGQYLIAEAMALKAGADGLYFVLITGDNFYPSGVSSVNDPDWLTKFEDPYAAPVLAVPFYPSLGNHDHGGSARERQPAPAGVRADGRPHAVRDHARQAAAAAGGGHARPRRAPASEQGERQRADDHLLLAEALLERAPVVRPPRGVRRAHHHLVDRDLVALDVLAVLQPQPGRGRARPRGQAAEALDELAADLLVQRALDGAARAVAHGEQDLDEVRRRLARGGRVGARVGARVRRPLRVASRAGHLSSGPAPSR
jgi:hypothetical protein